jgi:hypothetical protein
MDSAPTRQNIMDDSIFRQSGSANVPRGIENKAVDADPSELSGQTAATRPVWQKFVQNTVAQENNRAAVREENRRIAGSTGAGEMWKGADGKLIRKVGRQSEMLDANDYTDHPVAGAEARKSLWDREVRTWRKSAEDASFELRNPAFHAGGMTDRQREDAAMEVGFIPDGDPRKSEIQAKLAADDQYRSRKTELAQRAFDSEKKARELESTDPEAWWSSRSTPAPSEQRAGLVADAQAKAGEADAASNSAAKELADIDAKMAAGVRGSEVDALKARRAEIADAQAIAAEERAKAAGDIEAVRQEAAANRGFFSNIGAALTRGYAGASQSANILQGAADPTNAQDIADYERMKRDNPASKEFQDFMNAEGFANSALAFIKNPVRIISEVMAESAAQMVPSIALGVAGGAIGGAVTAAPTGEVAAPATVPIGAVIGGAVGAGSGSFLAEYGSAMMESMQNAGMDASSPESIQKFFTDPDKLAAAREFAVKRGVPIALFDAASMGIAGKFAKPLQVAVKSGEKVGASKILAATGAEIASQAGLGAAGEAAGQLVSEGQITDGKSIFLEGIAEVGSAPIEVASNLREFGGPAVEVAPEVVLEGVATELAAIDPEAAPPTAEEMARGSMIAPDAPAEGILIERELAAVEADDEANNAAAAEAIQIDLDAAIQNGAKESTINRLRTNLEEVGSGGSRAPLVRAVLKIASGGQLDDLTADELSAVGYKDSGDSYAPMTTKEMKDVGIDSPRIRQGADDSIIVTDGTLKKVGEVSERARSLVKMTEAEALQKAKERANQISTDTQNGAQGEPATGVFPPSEEGGVVSPHETNAAVGNPQPIVADEQPAQSIAAEAITGISGISSPMETPIAGEGGENAGAVPATKPKVAIGTPAHTRARAKFSKVKRRLKDRIIEGQERAITRPDGITINPKQIIDEAIARGMTDEQAGDYFDRVLDEEVRHLAQYDAARALYRANGGTGDFLPWMESHYADIWQTDFVATGKDAIIRDLYANSQAEWDAMTDGAKALEAIRMMSQGDSVTEQGKLWANISDALKQAITAALAALKQFRDIASPAIKSEITNLENALKSLSQPRAGTPKADGQKPAPGKEGAGTGGKAKTERDSGTGRDGGTQPERRDGAGSPLLVGSKVEFTKNGKTGTGTVSFMGNDAVRIRPDDDPAVSVVVKAGEVSVLPSANNSPATPADSPQTPKANAKEKVQGRTEKGQMPPVIQPPQEGGTSPGVPSPAPPAKNIGDARRVGEKIMESMPDGRYRMTLPDGTEGVAIKSDNRGFVTKVGENAGSVDASVLVPFEYTHLDGRTEVIQPRRFELMSEAESSPTPVVASTKPAATPADSPQTPKANEKDQRQGQGRQEGLLTPDAPGEKSPGADVLAAIDDELAKGMEGLFAAEFPEQNREYLAAVESGDMETAQRMVDEAAKAAGYQIGFLHGSQSDTAFEVFDMDNATAKGTAWFEKRKSVSSDYGRAMNVALKFNNPIDLRKAKWYRSKSEWRRTLLNVGIPEESLKYNPQFDDEGMEVFETLGDTRKRYAIEDILPHSETTGMFNGLRDAMVAAGHDGILLPTERRERFPTKGHLTPRQSGSNAVAFFPSQIKSADPVTYDTSGNVIPLSQRFNPASDSILYAANLPDAFTQPIPQDRQAILISTVGKYIAAGVNTPEGLAERLRGTLEGKLVPFSQSLWGLFKSSGVAGPWEPNWAGIYASLNQDATNENGPRTDAGAGEATSGDGEAGLGENSMRLAHQIAMRIKRKEKISIQQLTELATGIFGGRTGEAFEIKTAYDAVEMAINILIMDSKIEVKATGDQALKNIDQIREWLEYIPTQTRRTGEMDALQQFSTPPHFSYVASWVAAIRKNDNGLEPSSGLGGLAAWMERGGAVVQLNELSDRRREMLDALHIGPPATNHDAGLIHAIMLPDINSGKMPQPTVVVMNPPFSNNAAGRKDLLTGAKHIEEALKLLPPGGRLVAIVGEGMALEAPAYRGWWDKIRASNDVRANIKVDGSEYRKYGTTFSNRILVIDKVPPTGNPIVGGEVAKIDDLIPLLDGVRTTRPNQNATSGLSSNPPASDQQGGNAQDEQGGNDPGDVSGSPDPGAGAANPNTTRSGGKRGGNGTRGGRGGRTGGGNGNAGSGDVTAANPNDAAEGSGTSDSGGTPAVTNSEVERETIDADADRQIDGEEVFADYRPTFFRLKGAVKHPTTLVESSVMATTELPKSTVTLNLPQETVTSGALSDAQLEAIAYAAQAHETVFENGDRQGFFIGDGTGVGKGREIAGTILHNFREGRRKAVWISEKEGLSKDARRDLDGIGGKEIQVHEMVKKINRPPGDGVAFLTYDGLKNGFDGIDQEGKIRASNDKPSRIKTLLDWLGSDFDGVIALDEVHNAGNVIPIKGPRGYTDPSKKALAVVDLQKVFPNARVLYVSATGATEPNNLAFASRLGLWGIGKAFDRAEKFYTEIKSAGLSAMEIVARDLKSMGLYMARTLSFKGVNGGDPVGFDRLEHQLTPDQEEIYRKAAEGWQTIFTNLDLALDSTGAGRSASAKSAASSAFWGSQQRFFNGLLTAMQMPTALKDMKRRMEEGGSIVIQLINTNEAALDRAIDRALRENPENPDYETVDLSSRQDILDYIFNSFPVQQFHEVSDGEYADGRPKTKWVPLTRPDADGNPIPVLNPEAVAARDQLLEEIATLPLPDPPLEQLFNTFGAEAVAEITGRTRRLVRKTDDQGITRRILETGRGKPKIEKEKNDFLDGKRRILVFSDAGGTGFSYHAGANFKNQQKRYQYVVQAGWRADKAIQGLGRTHRADQVKTPHFLLVSTNVSGHKRFISTIARRLQQLGALTSGERKTTGQGLFNEDDNLEDAYAELAVRRFFNDLYRGAVAGMNFTNVSERLGYVKTVNGEPVNTLVNEDGSLNSEKIPPLKQFLNRILALPIGEQNATFEAFINRRAAFVEQAKENGSYDSGVETFIADEPKINRDEVVFEDPSSSASTRLVELGYKRYFNYNTFDFVKDWAKNPKWVASRDGKRIYALGQTDLTITEDDGRVLPAYRRFSIKSASTETQEKYSTGPRPGKAKIGDKFMVAGAEWELISIDIEEKRARIRQVGTEREKFASSTYELEELFEQTGNIVPGVNDNSNYVPEYFELTEDEAKGEWERVLAEEPKFEERASTFIVGSTLPVWHRIPFYFKQVKRVTLEDSKSFLGVIVPDDKIDQTRNQLGAAAAGVTPARVIDAIINRKSQVELSNGWMMKFTKSAGEDRIEVVGPDLEWSKGTYPRWDSYGFIERINFRPRFFIQPELKDIDRLLRYAPGMRIIESGDALQAATLPATARADSPRVESDEQGGSYGDS